MVVCYTEELPVRLAHRVKELDELPHNLSSMPSIKKVKNWYAQSFEVSHWYMVIPPTPSQPNNGQELITFPQIVLPQDIRRALIGTRDDKLSSLPEPVPNPSLAQLVEDYANNPHLHTSYHGGSQGKTNLNGNGGNGFNKLKLRVPMERR